MRTAVSFEHAFGKKQSRKRPKLAAEDYAQLLQQAEDQNVKYEERDDGNELVDYGVTMAAKQKLFEKGQSKSQVS